MESEQVTVPVLNRGMKAGLTIKAGRYIFVTPEIGEIVHVPIPNITKGTSDAERSNRMKYIKEVFSQMEDLNMGALTTDLSAKPITEVLENKSKLEKMQEEIEALKRQLAEKDLANESHSSATDAGVAPTRNGAMAGVRGSRRGDNHGGDQT